MTRLTRFCGVVAALLLTTFFAVPASAQATRTWISGVGDDANPCSRTAPCKTFAGAISKTAASGEIDCLDPAGYGGVTITKSITLDCGGGIGGQIGSILVAGTNGITVNGANVLVKIRNMSINGLAGTASPGLSGIKFLQGNALIVEHVGIFGFGGTTGNNGGVDFEPGSAGTPNAAVLTMLDTEIQYGLGDGVLIKPAVGASATANLNRVSALNNVGVGLRIDDANLASGLGIVASVQGSFFAANSYGAVISAKTGTAPGTILMTGTSLTGNSVNGIYSNGLNATFSIGGTTISGNATGMSVANTGKIRSFGDNYVFGNGTDGTPNGTPLTKE